MSTASRHADAPAALRSLLSRQSHWPLTERDQYVREWTGNHA
ncbi:hypothetical protein [Caballeronia sp. BR00000012568055]|nr:hypothetical protein [Caballeronia sp. BR00000012568055]